MTSERAQHFDSWYADMTHASRREAIQQSSLGLPPDIESSSLLPFGGIADIVDALAVAPGDRFADLGCGRGGYALEIGRRTGARLVGIDFSAVAIARATVLAAERWSDVAAEFRVGELTATGLDDAEVDAVMCIDAMQFAEPYGDGLAEALRILRSGGRIALTGWQPRAAADVELPARMRHDIAAEMSAAGFVDVVTRDMPSWQDAERALWEAAVASTPDDDPSLDAMREEGGRVLRFLPGTRRVLITARRG